MEKITRFGVSIEPQLLEQFDILIKKKKYPNRSEAIRDLIRENIIKKETLNPEKTAIGTLTILYNHHSGSLMKRLLDVEHNHHQEILTTTHIHIDHETCLEAMVLKGKVKAITHLADTIKALKGIKHGELVLTKIHLV